MAGMFYTIEEAAQKLGKTEDQVKELVEIGKLREFRDGAKRMFKVEEVDQMSSAEPEEIDIAGITGGDSGAADVDLAGISAGDSTRIENLDIAEISADDSAKPEDLDIAGITGGDSEVALVSDETNELAIEPEAGALEDVDDDLNPADVTGADTSITTIGINVLSETDDEYKLSDDTKGETQLDETSDEFADLDEEDINLDSVGSGSGLLDLSLQADDTSLGAVLDDILPGGKGEAEGAVMDEQGNLTKEAENIFEEAAPDTEMPIPVGRAVMPVYIKPAPDAVSNACGYSLFIPLIAMVFAVIVLLAGFKNISPAMLKSVAAPIWYDVAMIWYIAAGLAVVSIIIVAVAAMVSGKGGKNTEESVYQRPE